jgi:hypothetical protein
MKWKEHIYTIINEEENNIIFSSTSNLPKEINSDFLYSFLQECGINAKKSLFTILSDIISDISKNCSIDCNPSLLLYISNDNEIISSCIIYNYIFKNTKHIHHICGDYKFLLYHIVQDFNYFNHTITCKLDYNSDTTLFDSLIYTLSLGFSVQQLNLNTLFIIRKPTKSYELVPVQHIKHLLSTSFIVSTPGRNDVSFFTISLSFLKNIISNQTTTYKQIQTLLQLLFRSLHLTGTNKLNNIKTVQMMLKLYINYTNKKLISLFDLILYLIRNQSIYFIIYTHLTSSNKIKCIYINESIYKNLKDKYELYITRECIPNPDKKDSMTFKLESFQKLQIVMNPMITYILQFISKLSSYSSSISYIKNLFDNDCVELIPIRLLTNSDIDFFMSQYIKNNNTNLSCNAKIMFHSNQLMLLPNLHLSQSVMIKHSIDKSTSEYKYIDTMIDYTKTVTNSEIVYYDCSNSLFPSGDMLHSVFNSMISSNIKISILVGEMFFFFISLHSEYIQQLKINKNNKIDTEDIRTELINLSNEFNTSKYDNTSNNINNNTFMSSICKLFVAKLNQMIVSNSNITIFNVKGFTRNEINNTDSIEITYNSIGEKDCFNNTTDLFTREDLSELNEQIQLSTVYQSAGPFYQLDYIDLRHKNEEISIYAEDDVEDMNEQFQETQYENALMFEQFNRYGIPEEEFDHYNNFDTNEEEYNKKMIEVSNYKEFSDMEIKEQEEALDEYVPVEDKDKDEELNLLSNIDNNNNRVKKHMFKDDDYKEFEISSSEDYLIHPDYLKPSEDLSNYDEDIDYNELENSTQLDTLDLDRQ